MDAAARRTLEVLGESNAQDLANTVWAFAKLDVRDEGVMEAVAKVLVAAKTGPTRHDTSDTTRHDLTPTPTGVVSAD